MSNSRVWQTHSHDIFWLALAVTLPLSGWSQILIDTRNTGFQLSSPDEGQCVKFDRRGDGQKDCWSWPVAGSGNGWLVLPHDGKVDSGKDLFGNYTPVGCQRIGRDGKELKKGEWYCEVKQPGMKARCGRIGIDGYDALREYDDVYNGGNNDYVINEQDEVYSQLRVWIDDNPRDGIAQPNELYKLSDFGIYSISTLSVASRKQDKYANTFMTAGELNVQPEQALARAIALHDKSLNGEPLDTRSYDVWLVNGKKFRIDKDNGKHGFPYLRTNQRRSKQWFPRFKARWSAASGLSLALPSQSLCRFLTQDAGELRSMSATASGC